MHIFIVSDKLYTFSELNCFTCEMEMISIFPEWLTFKTLGTSILGGCLCPLVFQIGPKWTVSLTRTQYSCDYQKEVLPESLDFGSVANILSLIGIIWENMSKGPLHLKQKGAVRVRERTNRSRSKCHILGVLKWLAEDFGEQLRWRSGLETMRSWSWCLSFHCKVLCWLSVNTLL